MLTLKPNKKIEAEAPLQEEESMGDWRVQGALCHVAPGHLFKEVGGGKREAQDLPG